jgi:aminoglycoside phosphotransferase family enzyme
MIDEKVNWKIKKGINNKKIDWWTSEMKQKTIDEWVRWNQKKNQAKHDVKKKV